MSIEEKAGEVEALFQRLDQAIAQFQSDSTLHCKLGCGKCCFKADIEATVLEFIPFALHLYREGAAEAWYESLKFESPAICKILNPTQAGVGLCSQYPYRGLICRLFGFSARTNKYGKRELVTCEIIKTEQSGAYQSAEKKTGEGSPVPVMSDYYRQLHAIDFALATDFYPINQAILKAIETVLQYYAYR